MRVLQTLALPLGDVAAMERETGFEPATFSLARRCSTPEPLPHCCVPALPRRPPNYTAPAASLCSRHDVHALTSSHCQHLRHLWRLMRDVEERAADIVVHADEVQVWQVQRAYAIRPGGSGVVQRQDIAQIAQRGPIA